MSDGTAFLVFLWGALVYANVTLWGFRISKQLERIEDAARTTHGATERQEPRTTED